MNTRITAARGSKASRALRGLGALLNKGPIPYIVSPALLILGIVLVYLNPRSIPAFLLFLGAAALTYFLDMNKVAKLAMAVLVAVMVNPGVYRTLKFDLHMEPLATFFLLLAGRDLWHGRNRRAWVFAIVVLLCGSFSAIMVVGLGVSAVLAGREGVQVYDPVRRSLLQGLPAEELHGDVGLAAPLADLVDPAHIRVVHPGLELRLLDEPLEEVGVVAPEELQGHHPVEARIHGLENAPHAPFAKQFEGFKTAPLVKRLGLEDTPLPEPLRGGGTARGGIQPGICRRFGTPGRQVRRDLHGPVVRLVDLHFGQIQDQPPKDGFRHLPGSHQVPKISVAGHSGLKEPPGHSQGQHPLVSSRHASPSPRR